MKLHLDHTILVLAALAALSQPCHAEPPEPRKYDFEYSINNNSGALRVEQVFDDGEATYFQVTGSPSPASPAFFAVTLVGKVLLPATRTKDGQFITVGRLEKEWLVSTGGAKITVQYRGGDRSRKDPPVAFSNASPSISGGAAPAPVDASTLRMQHKALTSVSVLDPRDNLPTHTAALIPETAGSSSAERTAPPVASWRVRVDDQLISRTFQRWASDAKWEFSWEAQRDFQVAFPAQFDMSFEQAVMQAVAAFSESDAPIQAQFIQNGANRVLRIVSYPGNSSRRRQK